MDYKYTINIYNFKGTLFKTLYTNGKILTIGSGLCNSIRIQIPSINELHLKIYLEKKKVLAFGRDVFLNDTELSIGHKADFKIGDLIKIHKRSFQVKFTDPNEVIDQNDIIKDCPEELSTSLEIEPDLFINKEGVCDFSKNLFKEDPQMVTDNNKESNKRNNMALNNEQIREENNEEAEKEIVVPIEDDTVKNMLIENNEIVTNEVCGDLHTKREINIHREVETSHYIKEGVIFQEVTEKMNIEEYKVSEKISDEKIINNQLEEKKVPDNLKEEKVNSELKNDFEVQAAVKIIDASSLETKVEGDLEKGNLNSVKEAINSKQEEVNEEIKESFDTNVLVNTPINIIKKHVKDLGNQVLEKEILREAEEKINQNLDVNQNFEPTKLINEEETVFIKEKQNPVLFETDTDERQINCHSLEIKELENNKEQENMRKDEEINDKEKFDCAEIIKNENKDKIEKVIGEEDKVENEKVNAKRRGPSLRNKKEDEVDENGNQEELLTKKKKSKSSEKTEKIQMEDFDNLAVEKEDKKSVKKVKKEETSKLKQISKLTVTPRSTRKASVIVQNVEPDLLTSSKRIKRNASLNSESKASAEGSLKKSKNNK